MDGNSNNHLDLGLERHFARQERIIQHFVHFRPGSRARRLRSLLSFPNNGLIPSGSRRRGVVLGLRHIRRRLLLGKRHCASIPWACEALKFSNCFAQPHIPMRRLGCSVRRAGSIPRAWAVEPLLRPLSTSTSLPTPLLPPKSQSHEGKLTVVMDMDECMIHSKFGSDANDYRQVEDRQAHSNRPADFTFTLSDRYGTDTVSVFKRPGLDDFLQTAKQEFEMVVFTAGTQDYADPLLDVLEGHEPGSIFTGRLYRQHTSKHRSEHPVHEQWLARRQHTDRGRVPHTHLHSSGPDSHLARTRERCCLFACGSPHLLRHCRCSQATAWRTTSHPLLEGLVSVGSLTEPNSVSGQQPCVFLGAALQWRAGVLLLRCRA